MNRNRDSSIVFVTFFNSRGIPNCADLQFLATSLTTNGSDHLESYIVRTVRLSGWSLRSYGYELFFEPMRMHSPMIS